MKMRVMEKTAFWALMLMVEAAGGLRCGLGNPEVGGPGCLLSCAALLDDVWQNDGSLNWFKKPTREQPVMFALWEAFGAKTAEEVYRVNDSVCSVIVRGAPMPWEDFCAAVNLVPSK